MSQMRKTGSEQAERAAKRERDRRYRERMRAKGLRRVTLWVIDKRSPEFRDKWRRQSQAISADPREQALAETLSAEQDMTGWEP